MNRPAQIADLDAQFHAISQRAAALVECAGATRITLRPRHEAWSAAECLSHLVITAEAYLPVWRAAFQAASADSDTERPFRLDLWGRFFVWLLEPPARFRMPAPRAFEPVDAGPPERVLPAFLESQESLLAMLRQGAALPLDRIKIASPFNQRLHYNIWSSFCANASHHRRHLWQAERAAQALSV